MQLCEMNAVHWWCMTVLCLTFLSGFNDSVEEEDGVYEKEDRVYRLVVNAKQITGDVRRFWTNTGLCPPAPHNNTLKYFFGEDMRTNLALIGSLPYHGIEQVRIHWLLDLVSITGWKHGSAVYNFSDLDRLVQSLRRNRLRPGFELMGNPSGYFSDFENKSQVFAWADLVFQMARRYINIFGIDEVRMWNFESWNEPDCHDFDHLRITRRGFLNYYDACSYGLHMASHQLKFGGPGDACHDDRPTSYAYALYDHVTNGLDYFTGKPGVRMDFLSLHRKGSGSAQKILESELESIGLIRDTFPEVLNKPFYNDEADPLVGWNKDKSWRGDATYAALVTKVISQHINGLTNGSVHYALLSNDNAFLSYYPHQFTQRTLLARLQINNTSPPHTQFVKKPVYAVMALLSVLGRSRVAFRLTDSHGNPVSNTDNVGAIVTIRTDGSPNRTSWELSTVVYYCRDPGVASNLHLLPERVWVNITLQLPRHVVDRSARLALYSVDNARTNPYSVWLRQGKPDYPTRAQFTDMRRHEAAALLSLSDVNTTTLPLNLGLSHPQVLFLHVCTKTATPPSPVSDLLVSPITKGQVLITWTPGRSRCIRAYHVKFRPLLSPTCVSIGSNSTDTSLVYNPESGVVSGEYAVRGVDYWGRVGPWSNAPM